MYMSLPPTKQHWVYDDPSGVAEPAPYRRPWQRRRRPAPVASITVLRRPRVAHREG
jgi:hypothetical protein